MDTKKMLDLLNTQRHDFINHLQVISGFMQIHRETELKHYIQKTADSIAVLSKVSHLEIPEVSVVLLIAITRAEMLKIEFIFNVQDNLSGCTLPGDDTAYLLEELLNNTIDRLSVESSLGTKQKVIISITGEPEKGPWQIGIDAPDSVSAILLANLEDNN